MDILINDPKSEIQLIQLLEVDKRVELQITYLIFKLQTKFQFSTQYIYFRFSTNIYIHLKLK